MTQLDATEGHRATWSSRGDARGGVAEASFARFHDVLAGFWLVFWLMNGLDKFFNQPTFFGVTRDAMFIEYFSRIGLPESAALFALYSIGVAEVALGVSFIVALMFRERFKTLIVNNLEVALGIFVLFALGDILFGDRKELWEHGCYIGLIIMSYGVAQARLWMDEQRSQRRNS